MERMRCGYLLLFFCFMIGGFCHSVAYHETQPEPQRNGTSNQLSPPQAYESHNPIIINSNTDFSDQGWPGDGTPENPYIIEGLNITSGELCINITDTTVHFLIFNCFISSRSGVANDGIVMQNVTQGTLKDCIIEGHSYAIYLNDCSNCTLSNNIAFGAIGFSLTFSDNCTLRNNTVYEAYRGFNLLAVYNSTLIANRALDCYDKGFIMITSIGSILSNNLVVNTHGNGFQIASFTKGILTDNTAIGNSYGFYFIGVNRCEMKNNTSHSNSKDGFFMKEAYSVLAYNNLTQNTIWNNGRYGIYLQAGSANNTLYLNRLGNNIAANARNDGEPNAWDDGKSQGNYWSDYNGTGKYIIPGNASSIDNYPFVWEVADMPSTTTTDTSTTQTTSTSQTTPLDSTTTSATPKISEEIIAILGSITGIAVVVIVILVVLKEKRSHAI